MAHSHDSSHQDKISQAIRVTEEVYGKYDSTSSSSATKGSWTPQPYDENKGRYLWTDAFGVCNFLTLFHETKDEKYLIQAEALITNVHHVLGKNRSGTKRLGQATEENPLLGGLRIGKVAPEGDRDGDGQYFHYLTKWMFALNRMSIAKHEPHYNLWAIQLAQAVHPHFVHRVNDKLRMFWKMSIDLSKPMVRSEGNLDPYDGYVTYRLLQQTAHDDSILKKEIAEMNEMVQQKYQHYFSDDPLDLGEALWLQHWFANEEWATSIRHASLRSLERLWKIDYFSKSNIYRLAFREFGTSIGVQVTEEAIGTWQQRVAELNEHWSRSLYSRDRDITPVMFCTSLLPGVMNRNYHSQNPKI